MKMTTAVVIRHVETEGPGLLEEMLIEKGIDYRIVDATAQPIPEADILISMGGPMSVNDKDAWLQEEINAIRRHVNTRKPYFGVCLGAQLLAKALGGGVVKARVREVGNYEVQLTEKASLDQLFSGLPEKLNAFQWHGEAVKALPIGAAVLATGNGMAQAFGLKGAYGLQFHLEATAEMVESWIGTDEGYLAGVPTTRQKVMAEFTANAQHYKNALTIIFGRFLDMAVRSQEAKTSTVTV